MAGSPPLGREVQLDFSFGEQKNVAPHLIDPRGFFLGVNGLLGDDGSVFKRGGSAKISEAPFGTALRSIWDGWLRPGRRTFIASTTSFGQLGADGKTIASLGGAGFPAVPKVAKAFRDMLFIGGGVIYGGSRKGADYSTGTVKTTQGSKVIEGTGTAWTANVDVGMLLRIGGGSRIYIVSNVNSNTVIELDDAYEAAGASGQAYTMKRLEATTLPYRTADIYAVAGQRLIVCEGNIVEMSQPNKPHLYEATIPPQNTVVKNLHELEEGIQILGAETIGIDKVLIFHTGGITNISNLALDIIDGNGNSQHTITNYSRDVVLWGNPGITGWRGTLVVPAVDGVYLIDGTSGPVKLSTSIYPLYREYVQNGFTPGVAWTDHDHYFLPILNSAGECQDLLVCRLDRPLESRGETYYPWVSHQGAGAKVAAGAFRHPATPGEHPIVFGAGDDGYLLNLETFFVPSAAVKNDHDGSTHLFQLVTRDFSGGNLALVRFRRLVLLYELEAAAGEVPGISAEVGTGIRKEGLPLWNEVTWNDFKWASADETEFDQLDTLAPANAGAASAFAQNAWVWYMATRARYTRYRIQCADPVAKLTIRGLEIFAAQPEGVRLTKVR